MNNNTSRRALHGAISFMCLLLGACMAQAVTTPAAPFPYVWGTAYHVLPGTHNNESGYFSMCEGLEKNIYVGTAFYGKNAYLVQFDPTTETQKIVIDTNALCGLEATGYAAQAKIHTRNFVGPSGKIYVGSKQGEPAAGETAKYPGGYVMTYDPKTEKSENLGMPYPGEGVIDVVADEARGLIYIVTCEQQHWMLYDMKTKTYRELGLLLTPYATTLIDDDGRAHVIMGGRDTTDDVPGDFRMATYDPKTETVSIRPIEVDGKRWRRKSNLSIPIWVQTQDKRTAYLTLLDDPTLLRFDLQTTPAKTVVQAENLGPMLNAKNCISWNGLAMGPDGNVYATICAENETGFGELYLHHLTRYRPRTRMHEDLGVLAVKNPDFFKWDPLPDGDARPFQHGYQTFPDGVLSPLYVHQSLIVASDGTVYVTILYPFTLLRINLPRA